MSGLNLNRNRAPAEVDNVPDDLNRDMQAWVRAWPSVDKAIADFKKAVQAFQQVNREINQKAGRKLSDRSLAGEQKKAVEEIVARTTATSDALQRML
ncbi:MAG TPA: hypothetical protein PKD10_17610 [Paracoccaceae bacterium]|nr:hypothetical protein [Paracoccaceae bacterium]HMO72897.1 hypothetical protein [Paracoccaceae bacterium]